MRVRMPGTGSSDGWPDPWCGCSSCAWARSSGVLRRQTGAFVDDRLRLDVGHDGVRATIDLTRVEAVLVTHGHPDHHALPAWMWRGWSRTNRPLTLVGPRAVVAAARPEVDPTVTLVAVLRERGAVVASTAVHAIHLGHDNPPDLDDVLAGWGASAPRDGDVLELGR